MHVRVENTTNADDSHRESSRSSSSHRIPETPVRKNRAPPTHTQKFGQALISKFSRSPSVEAPELPSLDNIEAAADTNIDPAEVTRLRESRRALTTELKESTALIYRLRTRNAAQEADGAFHHSTLDTLRQAAELKATEERIQRKVWMGLCVVLAAGLAMYGYLCWYNGAEMEFVRTRRRERYGLRAGG